MTGGIIENNNWIFLSSFDVLSGMNLQRCMFVVLLVNHGKH